MSSNCLLLSSTLVLVYLNIIMTNNNECIRAIRSFNRFYTSKLGILNPRTLDSEYSLIEGRILYEIGSGCSIARELTKILSIDEGYLSRIIQKFERTGLLKRSHDNVDRRKRYLELTSQGIKVFRALNHRADDQIDTILSPLGEKEKTALVKAVKTIELLLGDRSNL